MSMPGIQRPINGQGSGTDNNLDILASTLWPWWAALFLSHV